MDKLRLIQQKDLKFGIKVWVKYQLLQEHSGWHEIIDQKGDEYLVKSLKTGRQDYVYPKIMYVPKDPICPRIERATGEAVLLIPNTIKDGWITYIDSGYLKHRYLMSSVWNKTRPARTIDEIIKLEYLQERITDITGIEFRIKKYIKKWNAGDSQQNSILSCI